MSSLRAWYLRFGGLFDKARKDRELSDELGSNLYMHVEDNLRRGMNPTEARRAALIELGGVEQTKEKVRDRRGFPFIDSLLQDFRFSVRILHKSSGFTAAAVLTLALGIGANTAIFSLMEALLMRSLPVTDPASLVVLKWHITTKSDTNDTVVHYASGYFNDDPKLGIISPIFPFSAFEALRKTSGTVSTVFAYRPGGKLNVVIGSEAEITGSEYVSGDYFKGLGVVPAVGRLIASDDDRAGAPSVAVLSYGFAQARFGDVSSAVGEKMLVDNTPFTIIGVAPRRFYGVDPSKTPDLYLPFHADLLLDPNGNPGTIDRYQDEHYYWTEMMARLRPGATLAQGQAELAPLFEALVAGTAATDLERKNLPQLLLQSGAGGVDTLRRSYYQPLGLLLAMVGLILAIACANIANLLLARSAARQREMAVRLSVGAGRWRLIRQLLTESVLLALLGGVAGILGSFWGIRLLTNLLSSGSDPFTVQPGLNLAVLVAALSLTALTGLLFGLAPALQAVRVDPTHALKESRSGGSPPRGRLRFGLGRMLVIFQLATCLLLLVGADLFVRTLANLHSLDVGFDRQNVLLFSVNGRQAGHRDPEILSFYNGLESRLAAIPGVLDAAMANSPLIGAGAWGWPVVPSGQPRPEKAPSGHGSGFSRSATRVLDVSPGFFSTMRIPLLTGRELNDHDRAGTPLVAVVNEAWARMNFGGANPVGHFATDFGLRPSESRQVEIVGLAKNARYDDLTGDFPVVVYLPVAQTAGMPVDEMTFFLRTSGDPLVYAGAVREIVRQADPRIPVAGLSTQTAQIENEMVDEKLFARLCTAFALLSLAITCVGLYATTSYAVARRTGEIGIRMALGARRETIIRMVLRDVLIMAIAGLLIGLPVALGASKLIGSLLFGVKPGDPWASAAAMSVLLAAALVAGYLPARRASNTDPIVALRYE